MFKKSLLLITLLSLILVLGGCSLSKNSSKISSKGASKDTSKTSRKGLYISYPEFKDKLDSKAKEWANGDYYVSTIKSGHLINELSSKGNAVYWKATVVKCESLDKKRDSERNIYQRICVGPSATITYAKQDTGLIGEGLRLKKDPFRYRSIVFDLNQVNIDAKEAEQIANKQKNYKPTGYETYTYELVPDKTGEFPIWQIHMACTYISVSDKKGPCDASKDYWEVSINATNGEVLD